MNFLNPNNSQHRLTPSSLKTNNYDTTVYSTIISQGTNYFYTLKRGSSILTASIINDNGSPEIYRSNREISQDSLYYYTWDTKRNAWITGKDITETANAVIGGLSKCPVDIKIPGKLPRNGNHYPVEVIGRYSFYSCAKFSNTKTVFVPKQVKVIKERGLGVLDNVYNFTIEAGSQLEIVDLEGLAGIGYNNNDRTFSSNLQSTKTLILPSTLYFASTQSIYWNNLFNRVIYCGSYYLPLSSELMDKSPETKVYVTSKYTYSTVLGINPSTDISSQDIEEACKNFERGPALDCTHHSSQTCPILTIISFSMSDLSPGINHTK